MKNQTITNDLGDLLSGEIRLDGKMRRMDGSWLFWATTRSGERISYTTPRPDDDPKATVKARWFNDGSSLEVDYPRDNDGI